MKTRNYGLPYRSMGFLWALARLGGGVMLKGDTIHARPFSHAIKGPAIVVSNHVSMFDWYFITRALPHTALHMVMGRYFLGVKWFDTLLRHGGVIPKAVFAHDNASAIASMRALRRGGVLAVFPEARLGVSGRLESIPQENIVMIKRLGLPVYSVHIDGASLMNPKWGARRDGALVEVSARQLFTAEEIKGTSLDAVRDALYQDLWFDDFQFLADHPEIHYRVEKPAEHLEYAVWSCPKCGAKYTLESDGNHIHCTACGLSATMDDRYGLSDGPATAQGWYDNAVDRLYAEADKEGEGYQLTSPVTLGTPDPQEQARATSRGTRGMRAGQERPFLPRHPGWNGRPSLLSVGRDVRPAVRGGKELGVIQRQGGMFHLPP
ncbi:MAG: 1-acyl-sn-glycerol-3-phosphate acyltransferase [Sphaerochaeta sp.]|nr:1-acyl-sn-glycerol-3-phosphate acyltransferase [Sphaerochaeta sp.]MCH3919807.1 1-acyl-sn-glycerol-3-phosphate acyltransferase [Sphaerochaeta sp.]